MELFFMLYCLTLVAHKVPINKEILTFTKSQLFQKFICRRNRPRPRTIENPLVFLHTSNEVQHLFHVRVLVALCHQKDVLATQAPQPGTPCLPTGQLKIRGCWSPSISFRCYMKFVILFMFYCCIDSNLVQISTK